MLRFDLATLFAFAGLYLLLLFGVAYVTERGWVPRRLASHPLVYALSLGVYASTWTYYGSVGFAEKQGLLFITIYLGVSLAFCLAPVMLLPILRLCRTYRLTSVADLFAFRFHSRIAGVLVTSLALAGALPYIALQIRAVAQSTEVLSRTESPDVLALWFCVMLIVFSVIFGARHVTLREKHPGLITAMAFESALKCIALLLVAGFSVYHIFGGWHGLNAWLHAHPQSLSNLIRPARQGPWFSLLFLTFAASFLLPRMYHMLFTENPHDKGLFTAAWAQPFFLFLLCLAIPPLLWCAQAMRPPTSPDFYVIGLAAMSHSPWLAVLTYLGGISAASAMVIVSTLALSSMVVNHLILPVFRLPSRASLYRSLLWVRRLVIAVVILAAYGFYALLGHSGGLVGWGLVSFLAMAQFIPGIAGVLLWPRATRAGFICGVAGGGTIWLATALIPPLIGSTALVWLGIGGLGPVGGSAIFWSLAVNVMLFVGVSLFTEPSTREMRAADACRQRTPSLAPMPVLAGSPRQFVEQLSQVMDAPSARTEVRTALHDLGLSWSERRPDRLFRLREQIERNLTGMIGPVLAGMIVDERLRIDPDARAALAQSVRLIEERLERSRVRLRGLTAELDQVRRYHRQIIEDLPLGVCAVTEGARVVRWNAAMQRLTGIAAEAVLGQDVAHLPAPWGEALDGLLRGDQPHLHRRSLDTAGGRRWYSLHKAQLEAPVANAGEDTVMLVEDTTEVQRLERKLAHSERLASIGRLAAGVAHEIGNPVTGIACLAQELDSEALQADQVRESARDILHQTGRINRIVQSLVSFAHGGTGGGGAGDAGQSQALDDVIGEAVHLVRLSREARTMRFEVGLDQGLSVSGDRLRLVQIFVNLLVNAVDACGGEGTITIDGRRDGGVAEVVVADDGPGISDAIRDKVLEPFFTTKPVGSGTGLGLHLVYTIVQDLGGELLLDRARRGARVRVRLKAADAALTRQSEAMLSDGTHSHH